MNTGVWMLIGQNFTQRKRCPSVTLSTTNFTCTDLVFQPKPPP